MIPLDVHLRGAGSPGGSWITWGELDHLGGAGSPGGSWITWGELDHLGGAGSPGGSWIRGGHPFRQYNGYFVVQLFF